MTLATSKNLTVVGICMILGAIGNVVVALFDGDAVTNPDWGLTVTTILAGIGMIGAKGAQSTGGTVASTPEAAVRIAPDNAAAVKAAQ